MSKVYQTLSKVFAVSQRAELTSSIVLQSKALHISRVIANKSQLVENQTDLDLIVSKVINSIKDYFFKNFT